MKTFIIGDIHGAHKALLQCFQRSSFNYQEDRLIALGDVTDGWPEVHLCIDELLKIKHLDYILGNHDFWTLAWAHTGNKPDAWVSQGGWNTLVSYQHKSMPQSHVEFLENAHRWVEENKILFVHAGIDPQKPLSQQTEETLMWDRTLIQCAVALNRTNPEFKFAGFDEIFVGHTPTQNFNSQKPLKFCNVWDLDTGAGWKGQLTIMDMESKEYWQSDPSPQMYPHVKGRGG